MVGVVLAVRADPRVGLVVLTAARAGLADPEGRQAGPTAARAGPADPEGRQAALAGPTGVLEVRVARGAGDRVDAVVLGVPAAG